MARTKKQEKIKQYYIIRIGPLLKEVLNKQKELISEVTYNTVDSSDYEAGEIIAKKVISVL